MEVGWGGSLSQFTETLPQVRGLGSEALPKILKRSSLYQVPPSSSRHAWKTAPLPGRSCHYHSFCFPAPRLTFLIHKTTCLMNLPQIAPLYLNALGWCPSAAQHKKDLVSLLVPLPDSFWPAMGSKRVHCLRRIRSDQSWISSWQRGVGCQRWLNEKWKESLTPNPDMGI